MAGVVFVYVAGVLVAAFLFGLVDDLNDSSIAPLFWFIIIPVVTYLVLMESMQALGERVREWLLSLKH